MTDNQPKSHGTNKTGFVFGRMFDDSIGIPMTLKLSACAAIGQQMTKLMADDRNDSELPAGYTYFGQFVDHDVSFDETPFTAEGDNNATDAVEATPDDDLVQERSPSLDLDSLYGGAEKPKRSFLNGAKFRLGSTVGTEGLPPSAVGPVRTALGGYDLPRMPNRGPGPETALIGDPRNDENLAVAQTHLMWLKFHNHIVDKLRTDDPGKSPNMLFETARELVTKHYQHIVLHDFVRRFIDESVYDDVIQSGNRQFLTQIAGEIAFMPLEFSVAAYRHGHSQVRETYDWNVNFGPGRAIAPSPFTRLFDFSAVSGNFFGQPRLPTSWIPDFRRLFDLSDADLPNLVNGAETGILNPAKQIDPFIAAPLGNLPAVQAAVMDGNLPFANLAALNLRRGSMRALPSGQDVAEALGVGKRGSLTEAKMRQVLDGDDAFIQEMEMAGFFERTPLWLYILFEAAALGKGETLGKVGSTIVAETFLTLAITSRISIISPKGNWHPDQATDALGTDIPITDIAKLLLWMDEIDPIIDPLQDRRIV